jgi:hypothetical protein
MTSSSDEGPIEQQQEPASDASSFNSQDGRPFGSEHIVAFQSHDHSESRSETTKSPEPKAELLPLRQRRMLTAAYFASYFLIGVVMASIGPALIMLAQNTGSTEDQVKMKLFFLNYF